MMLQSMVPHHFIPGSGDITAIFTGPMVFEPQAHPRVYKTVGIFVSLMVIASVMEPVESVDCFALRHSFGNFKTCRRRCKGFCNRNGCRKKRCSKGSCQCMTK
nr:unnamed protein product [Callosobruchus analis]